MKREYYGTPSYWQESLFSCWFSWAQPPVSSSFLPSKILSSLSYSCNPLFRFWRLLLLTPSFSFSWAPTNAKESCLFTERIYPFTEMICLFVYWLLFLSFRVAPFRHWCFKGCEEQIYVTWFWVQWKHFRENWEALHLSKQESQLFRKYLINFWSVWFSKSAKDWLKILQNFELSRFWIQQTFPSFLF